jgi:hypothetical protein
MALAASRARLCAAVAATAAPADAPAAMTAKAARAARGVVNMPSRAVAAVLLRADEPVPNGQLYAEAREYGLLQSHRHFKHVLKMMKLQRRVQVIPGPPVCFGCVGAPRLATPAEAVLFRFALLVSGRGLTFACFYSLFLADTVPAAQQKLGGRKLTFRTKLTRRGGIVYRQYLGDDVPLPGAAPASPGLADALPTTPPEAAAA